MMQKLFLGAGALAIVSMVLGGSGGDAGGLLPPWPIFKVAVGLNEFFEAAARATRPPAVHVKSLATAYWQSEVLYSLTKSGVLDSFSGPAEEAGCDVVAEKLGLSQQQTCRMMAAGVHLGLLVPAKKSGKETSPSYSLSAAGDLLRADHAASLRDFALMINEETRDAWRAAGSLDADEASGFKRAFGDEFWNYHSHKGRERQMAQFDAAMKALSADIAKSVMADWAPPREDALVCDVGGSLGHMVGAMAQRYPALRGLVFDLEPVVDRAKFNLKALGLEDRVETLAGSFFEAFPPQLAECDVFYLKFILHDWDDAACAKILSNILAVAKPGSAIVATDFVLGLDGPAMELSKRLMDINMMASNPKGARERTWDEYAALFPMAGIKAAPELIKLRDIISAVRVAL